MLYPSPERALWSCGTVDAGSTLSHGGRVRPHSPPTMFAFLNLGACAQPGGASVRDKTAQSGTPSDSDGRCLLFLSPTAPASSLGVPGIIAMRSLLGMPAADDLPRRYIGARAA